MGMVDGRPLPQWSSPTPTVVPYPNGLPLPQPRAIRVECREYQNGVGEGDHAACTYGTVVFDTPGGWERDEVLASCYAAPSEDGGPEDHTLACK